jgi:hypothetical protein
LAKVDVTSIQGEFWERLALTGVPVSTLFQARNLYVTMNPERAFGLDAVRDRARECHIDTVKSYRLEMVNGKPIPKEMDPPGRCPTP